MRGGLRWALETGEIDHLLPRCLSLAFARLASTPAIALYSVVCSQCSTCGLSQQKDTLPELFVRSHTVSYRIMDRTRDIKRLELNRQPQHVP